MNAAERILSRHAAAKSLRQLLCGLAEVSAVHERAVHGVGVDSRTIEPGDLFIALGAQQQHRAHIRQAVANGAVAVVHDSAIAVSDVASDITSDIASDIASDASSALSSAVSNAKSNSMSNAVSTASPNATSNTSSNTSSHAPSNASPNAPSPASSNASSTASSNASSTESPPRFAVADLAQRTGEIAARFFARPSAQLRVIGVTGTNGKTTCAHLLAQAFNALGVRCALLGTLGNGFPDALTPTPLTTDNAVDVQRHLAELLSDGARAVCMEASSHGLAQGRVNGVQFDAAVFTNLSRDHLDYHGDMRRYARAKQTLFGFDNLRCAVINADDSFARELLDSHRAAHCITYGIHAGEVRAHHLRVNQHGVAFDAQYRNQRASIRAQLLGEFNATNLLAVIATLLGCGYSLDQIAPQVERMRAPPGRMELLRANRAQPAVVIDYAHTPHALECALHALAQLCRGRLAVVFGAGGNRDAGKRFAMGEIAERLAARVILTDDNPRTESPDAITAQIARGMRNRPRVIHERRAAIDAAISEAAPDDIVLIAGKGHECAQVVGARTIEMNDRAIALDALARVGGTA